MSVLRKLTRRVTSALVFDRFGPNWATGVRMAVMVGVPLSSSLLAGRPDVGLLVTLAALNVGLADPGGRYRSRASATVLASALMIVAIAVATLVAGTQWLAVVAVAVWVFAMSLVAHTGPAAPGVAFVSSVIFVVGLGLPADPSDVAFRVAWFSVGCGWGLLVTVSVWPLRPDNTGRVELARAFRLMADFMSGIPHGDDQRAARTDEIAAAIEAARDTVSHRGAGTDAAADLVAALAAADGVETGLGAIDRALAASPAVPSELAAAIAAVAHACDEVGEAIVRRRQWGSDTLSATVRSLEPVPLAGDAALARNALILVATELANPRTGNTSGDSRQTGRTRRQMAAMVDPGSIAFRHAVRVACVVGIAQAISDVDPFAKSYWIPLAAVVVLKPDLGSTVDRAFQRVAGTIVGSVLAFVVISLADTRTWPLAVAVVTFAFLMAAVIDANYTVGVVCLTPTVILLLAIDGGGVGLVVDRIGGTLVGGALALLGAALLWPLWARRTLASELSSGAEAADRYLVHVTDEPDDIDDVGAAHRRAERARSSAVAIQRRMLSEPLRDQVAPADVVAYCRGLQALIETTSQLRATWLAEHDPVAPGSQATALTASLSPAHRRLTSIVDEVFREGRRRAEPEQPRSDAVDQQETQSDRTSLLVSRIDCQTLGMQRSAERVAAELAAR